MTPGRPPRLPLALLTWFVRGEGAEHVIGDAVERWSDDIAGGVAPRAAGRRFLGDTLATTAAWWRPAAIRQRRRARAGRRRDAAGGAGLDGLTQDLRVAARTVARRPGMAVAVAATLGLGIGAAVTIFSVVNGVMLRPLPYATPGTLVTLGTTFPGREWEDGHALQHLAGMSMANYRDLRARARAFTEIAALEATNVLLPDRGEGPELARAARASDNFFTTLGVAPVLGRGFTAAEHEVGADPVVLLSYGAWERRFGKDPSIVGRRLDAAGPPATIVGVLPRGFEPPEALFPVAFDFWMPLQPAHARYADRGSRSLALIGRLAPGVRVAQARAEVRGIADQLAAEFPDGNVYPDGTWFGMGVNDLHAETVGATGQTLLIFLAASGLLLVLAALNAASLVLARSLDRVRELRMRMALGAGRGRVVRLLVAEAGILAALGGAIGVGLAFGGVEAFVRFAPRSIPRTSDVRVDLAVLAVAAAVSLGAGLLAGLLPAFHLSGRGVLEGLHRSGRTLTSGTRARSVLVGGQLALAVVLVSGAGLLLASFMRIRGVEAGLDPTGLITMNVATKRPQAPSGEPGWRAWDAVLAEVRAVPGLRAVAGTTNPPFQSPFWAPRVLVPGDAPEAWREGIAGYAVTPGYFDTMGTRLLGGRDFGPRDAPGGQPVAVVNEAFARLVLRTADPLGTVIRYTPVGDHEDELVPLTIVGLVEDVVQTRVEEGPQPAIYVPYTQSDWPLVQVAVRTDRPAADVVGDLRQAVARFNPAVPPTDVRTMEERMAATRTTPRFQAMLFGAFGTVALLLAATGLYGSMAHAVWRRRRELGVRMALGAARRRVLWMVLGAGMRTSVIALAAGLLGALAATRVLAGFLYGVAPTDPTTLGGVILLLLAVSAAACVLPARRATRVDPVEVLRAE